MVSGLIAPPFNIGSFAPLNYSATAPYAALGTVQTQILNVETNPIVETVWISIPGQVLYQSNIAGVGSANWYLPNGTYLTSFTDTGALMCTYTNGTLQDEVNYYLESMYLAGYRYENGRRVDTYAGMNLDVSSCGQRIASFYTVDAETGFIETQAVIFPESPGGYKVIINTMFVYNQTAEVGSKSWAIVPPLPAICTNPGSMCDYLFPDGPYLF